MFKIQIGSLAYIWDSRPYSTFIAKLKRWNKKCFWSNDYWKIRLKIATQPLQIIAGCLNITILEFLCGILITNHFWLNITILEFLYGILTTNHFWPEHHYFGILIWNSDNKSPSNFLSSDNSKSHSKPRASAWH